MIKKVLLAAGVAALVACSAAPTEDLGSNAASIIKGTSSDATQDAVVLIMIYDPTQNGQVAFCTGSLLTSKLVLTARHCVSKTDESVACDKTGTSVGGGTVYSNNVPSTMYIFTGTKLPDFNAPTLTPQAKAKKIVTDGAKNLCNHDIGLIELDREITNGKILPIRLDGDATKGETFTAVGWGVTDKTDQPSVRQQRAGIKVLDIGPADTVDGPIAPNELQVGESICSGDSGGPAIATTTGSIIGVVSRGGNGTDPSSNPAAACEGTATYNLYTRPAPFKDLIVAAATELGQTVWIEGQPDPRLATNDTACGVDTDCQSGHCNEMVCAQDCTTDACDTGYTCSAAKLCIKNVALKHSTTTSGCAAAPGNADGGLIAGLAVGLLVIASRKKKNA